MNTTISAEDLLRDIFHSANSLRWFEQKYGLLSETFYHLFQAGLLQDEEPDNIQTYLEWAGLYNVYLDRRQRYNQAIEN